MKDDPLKLYQSIIDNATDKEKISLPSDPDRAAVLELVKTTTKPVYLICIRKADYDPAQWSPVGPSTEMPCDHCGETILVHRRDVKATRICLQCGSDYTSGGRA